MVQWIDQHGILVALVAFIFSTVIGAAPKELPKAWGFWRLWGFGAVQALGANASKFAEQSPVIQKLSATELKKDDEGHLVTTNTQIATTPAAGGAVPKL